MKENPASRLISRALRFGIHGPMAPRLRLGYRSVSGQPESGFFRLPFRRSLPAILVSGGLLAVFCIPFFTVSGLGSGSGGPGLFDLLFRLFSLFWLLGWSVGVVILLAVFLVLALGAETLQLRPGCLQLRLEVLRVGVGVDFQAGLISNLRWQPSTREDGITDRRNRWRGDHLAFEYGGETVRMGSSVTAPLAARIIDCVNDKFVSQSRGIDGAEPGRHSPDPAALETAATAVEKPPQTHNRIDSGPASTVVLVIANLIPLAGVLLDDWSIGDIMLLFWAESAIIGVFNLVKMWIVGRWSVLFLGPFFIAHFGGFMAGHLLFIYALFLSGPEVMEPSTQQVAADFVQLWPALLGLLVSHGISLRFNFLGRREYLVTDVRQQMSAPYRRIVIMHLTLIFGGFLTMALDVPLLALFLLILLKIAMDVRAHRREHRCPGMRSARKEG